MLVDVSLSFFLIVSPPLSGPISLVVFLGRGAAANDPDDLDDIVLPPPPLVPAPVVVEPDAAEGGGDVRVDGVVERRGERAHAEENLRDVPNAVDDGGPVGERWEGEVRDGENEQEGGQEGADDVDMPNSDGGCNAESAEAVPADDESHGRHLERQGDDDGEDGKAAAGEGEGAREGEGGGAVEDGGGAAMNIAPEERAVGEENGGRAEFGRDAGARGLAEDGEVDADGGGGEAAAEDTGVDVGAVADNAGGAGEEDGRERRRASCLAEAARVSAAGSLVCLALAVLPAVVVLLPLLTGKRVDLFSSVVWPSVVSLCIALAWHAKRFHYVVATAAPVDMRKITVCIKHQI